MNDITYRLKIVMGDLSGREFATRLGKSPTTVNEYLKGRMPPADFIERVCVCFGIASWWLLTGNGEMFRSEANGHVANGNNIIQGAHIDAEEVHLQVHQPGIAADPGHGYADPIDAAFLSDWKSLTEVGRMRVWTLLKEEKKREKEGKFDGTRS